ncbi:Baculoviral IAP repeat-containing protein 7 [Bulinus truncatus]|nr:Baculoviral IAP repeat-containing protein 7 [Bulinus truncatus]
MDCHKGQESYGDCTRCFYCGGGLRNWEDDDDVWVEHARWFQRCAYVKQKMGQVFVSTVQNMNTEFEKITMAMVNKKLGVPSSTFYIDSLTAPLKRDPAVRAIVALGYLEKDVIEVAEMIKLEGNTISAVTIMEKLGEEKKSKIHSTQVNITLPAVDSDEANEIITQLKERNGQLRQQTACKICMDGEVSVVFLPWGHLNSCTECASAMRNCPLCRVQVRGIVRAFMGD